MLNYRVAPSEAKKWCIKTVSVGLVPYMRSSPGIGKSSIAREIAAEYNLKFIDVRLSQYTPEDLNGIPFREGDKAVFLPFNDFPVEGDELPVDPKTGHKYDGWLINLDEFSSAKPGIQAASYKLVLDRMVNNKKLHERVIMIACGNLESDRAVVNPLSTASQSRFIHLEVEVSYEDFKLWGYKNAIDTRVMAFIAWQPEKLHQFDPDHEDRTFPCPRTWEFVSRLIKGENDISHMKPLLAGTIGEGMAIEFVTFCDVYDKIPKLEDIVRDPMNALMPMEISSRYATITSLIENTKLDNFKPILQYIGRFEEEEQVIYFRSTIQRHPHMRDEREFSKKVMQVMRFIDAA